MKRYIEYSADIYGIYLEFFCKDDIFVYSVDEVFIDVSPYLKKYKMTAKQLAVTVCEEVFGRTGIRATCGIGTNLYLAKIALDITAKHSRILSEFLTSKALKHPLGPPSHNRFWRMGEGTAKKLASRGYTQWVRWRRPTKICSTICSESTPSCSLTIQKGIER